MIKLAANAPAKNAMTSMSAETAAPSSPIAMSLPSRPTLPVTCDVNEPIITKPPEFTKPATKAR
jgi:hypothetical protein